MTPNEGRVSVLAGENLVCHWLEESERRRARNYSVVFGQKEKELHTFLTFAVEKIMDALREIAVHVGLRQA